MKFNLCLRLATLSALVANLHAIVLKEHSQQNVTTHSEAQKARTLCCCEHTSSGERCRKANDAEVKRALAVKETASRRKAPGNDTGSRTYTSDANPTKEAEKGYAHMDGSSVGYGDGEAVEDWQREHGSNSGYTKDSRVGDTCYWGGDDSDGGAEGGDCSKSFHDKEPAGLAGSSHNGASRTAGTVGLLALLLGAACAAYSC
mmetsp:Transcript_59381/g.141559  ORF Transcript_59381/g.141559 Transcript_59381/m.141559 type:complete len:202 (-) Transcript_59381:70-675(-)